LISPDHVVLLNGFTNIGVVRPGYQDLFWTCNDMTKELSFQIARMYFPACLSGKKLLLYVYLSSDSIKHSDVVAPYMNFPLWEPACLNSCRDMRRELTWCLNAATSACASETILNVIDVVF
jgi:hypothetical protein